MTRSGSKIAVLGSGPAGLMLADVLASQGHTVKVFERRNGLARKLFIAGSSGLNISNTLPLNHFITRYSGAGIAWSDVLRGFTPDDWCDFIRSLGLETFAGTSGRYFTRPMNARPLITAWRQRLKQLGVMFFTNHECLKLERIEDRWTLHFEHADAIEVDTVCLCLGGGSYEEQPPHWPEMLRHFGVHVKDFKPSNVGFQVRWPEAFLAEAEGRPLKNICFTTGRGSMRGDLMVTRYGIEGTPVYTFGDIGMAAIDLKPDMTLEEMHKRCLSIKENLTPLRRIKKTLSLGTAAMALLFHLPAAEEKENLESMLALMKQFPIALIAPQPLEEAISSRGGVALDELDQNMMIHKMPGCFAIGEMLDWDAPTGGFLIQGCVSQAVYVGRAMQRYLQSEL